MRSIRLSNPYLFFALAAGLLFADLVKTNLAERRAYREANEPELVRDFAEL